MNPYYPLIFSTLLITPTFISGQESITYNADVRPILSDKCFLCHGPDEANNKAGLRLDTEEAAYSALKESSGHAIVPHSLEKSVAWQRITSSNPDKVMPTPESNLVLTAKEKETIAKWIQDGAKYEPHWSFVPLPESVEIPTPQNKTWPVNAIDHFVAARLDQEKLKPSPEAPPSRWLRRVTLDLTGLPPTLEQIASFEKLLKDHPEKAHEETVKALLSTPDYAEHMTVDWLDTARYADTFGYHTDSTFTAWPYRDWVIKSFQQDMPYDQFITESLAGDMLPDATRDQKIATTFNRLHRITNEGGSNFLEFFVDGVSDRVNTVGTAFLGLTMECSKCHDHKYDPISQKEYFQLYAFFNSINESGVYNHGKITPPPSLLLPDRNQEKKLTDLQKNIDQLTQKLGALEEEAQPSFEAWKKETLLRMETAAVAPSSATQPVKLDTQEEAKPIQLTIADQTGHFDFNKSHKKPLESRIQPKVARKKKNKEGKMVDDGPLRAALGKTTFVPGPEGYQTGVTLDGDRGIVVREFFKKERYTPFTVGLWINDTIRAKHPAMLVQRTHGHDVGYNGLDLRIEDGHLVARVYRSWPDNGIGVKSIAQIPQNEWHHVTWAYDGTSKHEGLKLYLNGKELETEKLGKKVWKSVNIRTYQNGSFIVGSLFRGRGFKGGQVDEIKTFDRALTPIEIRHLSGTKTLNTSFKTAPAEELRAYYLHNFNSEYRDTLTELEKAHTKFVKLEDQLREIPIMEEMEKARPAYLLSRGNFDAPRTPETLVKRETPAILVPFPEGAPRNRLGLAQWLTLPNHPLTTRVFVNRIWQQFFGAGIVTTTENFGLQGALPTHPELLDWLCRDFINQGWSVKHLVKQIVLSATYRQQSVMTPELHERDIDNKLLARGPAHRLSGEQIRDAALLSSGLLRKKVGGGTLRPYDPIYQKKPNKNNVYRRSLYTFWKRTKPQNNITIFDKPSLEVCSVKRTRTNSPAQALVLLNDTQFVEAARHLATTMIKASPDDDERIRLAWKRVTSREPSTEEMRLLSEILAEQKNFFADNRKEATELMKVGLIPFPKELDPVEAAAMTIVCQAIYNTDAAIWKR